MSDTTITTRYGRGRVYHFTKTADGTLLKWNHEIGRACATCDNE